MSENIYIVFVIVIIIILPFILYAPFGMLTYISKKIDYKYSGKTKKIYAKNEYIPDIEDESITDPKHTDINKMKQYKEILPGIFVVIAAFEFLIVLSNYSILAFTFLFSFFVITLPSTIFRNIVMGSKKRAIQDQMYTEVQRMFMTIGEIVYDDWEEIRIPSELLTSKINLGSNQIFIKRQI